MTERCTKYYILIVPFNAGALCQIEIQLSRAGDERTISQKSDEGSISCD